MSQDISENGDTSGSDDENEVSAQWYSGNRGPDREGMVNEFLPGQEDWPAKTVLDVNDPARVAALRNFDELFPECSHHQPVIDDFLDEFLKSRTSVAGQSRRQFVDILMSMFGGKQDDDSGSMLAEALAADINDDD